MAKLETVDRAEVLVLVDNVTDSLSTVPTYVENEFPRDTRVRNEAFTLAAAGLRVSVIALRGKAEESRASINGVSN